MLRYSTLPTERFTTLKHHIQWKLFITNSIFGSKHWEGNTLYDYFYSIQMSNFTGPTGTHFTRNCELTIPWAANFLKWAVVKMTTLQWRHYERDGVSNHRCLDCLLNRLFRCRSRKHQSSASLVFVGGIRRWPMDSPHKGSVTRKIFPFDDVIRKISILQKCSSSMRSFYVSSFCDFTY